MKMLLQVYNQNYSSKVREISIIDSPSCFGLAIERIDDNYFKWVIGKALNLEKKGK
jgi:hypothetical protein